MNVAYIGAGSNIGDKVGYIQQANLLLSHTEKILVVSSSSLYETEPVGNKNQDWFVNAAIKIETTLTPVELLKTCNRIEHQLGRIRENDSPKWGPRKIDLDILIFGDEVISNDILHIPHPGLHLRAFALVPLMELAPDFVHPTIGKTIEEIHSELSDPEEVYLYGTRIE